MRKMQQRYANAVEKIWDLNLVSADLRVHTACPSAETRSSAHGRKATQVGYLPLSFFPFPSFLL